MVVDVVLDEGAFMPEKAHDADAGFDIRCKNDGYIAPHGSVTFDTGVHMAIPKGYVGMLKSKSGLNVKFGLRGEGVVDAAYTGSIVVKLYNDTDHLHAFDRGDKIIQIVILPIPEVTLHQVDHLKDTERGTNGFGSTGK